MISAYSFAFLLCTLINKFIGINKASNITSKTLPFKIVVIDNISRDEFCHKTTKETERLHRIRTPSPKNLPGTLLLSGNRPGVLSTQDQLLDS